MNTVAVASRGLSLSREGQTQSATIERTNARAVTYSYTRTRCRVARSRARRGERSRDHRQASRCRSLWCSLRKEAAMRRRAAPLATHPEPRVPQPRFCHYRTRRQHATCSNAYVRQHSSALSETSAAICWATRPGVGDTHSAVQQLERAARFERGLLFVAGRATGAALPDHAGAYD